MQNKKMFIGRVKNCKKYPEGKTSLLVSVTQVDDDKIVPHHVNLCIQTEDAEREDLKYASIVGFEAADFQQWRIGQDRFLGTRMSEDKTSPKNRLPALSETAHPKLGQLDSWADQDYLTRYGVDGNLYLKQDVTPIYSLIGFNPESVALHENYKPEIPVRLTASETAAKVYDHAAAEAAKVDNQVV